MSKQWKLTLVTMAACVLAVAAPQAASEQLVGGTASSGAAAGHGLVALSVDGDGNGRPVITLSSDGPINYESFVLDGPDRLVLDLSGVVNRLDRYKYPVQAGGVAQVRAGQHLLQPQPVTRVVFDLHGPLAYRIDEVDRQLVVRFGDETDAPVAVHEVPRAVDAIVDEMTARTPVEEPAEEIAATVVGEPAPEVATKVAELPVQEPQQAESSPLPAAIAQAPPAEPVAESTPLESRSVEPSAIAKLLNAPPLAAPAQETTKALPIPEEQFATRQIVTEQNLYGGKRISLNLVDADIKQVFRLFHEISGLNFVLDPDVSGRVTIVLDQVPWDQALDLILKNNGLDKVLEGNVVRIAPTSKLASEAASRKQLKEAEELEVEPITLTRTLSYAKAEDVQKVIRDGGILSPRGKVIVDTRTNTLIISDIPKKVEPLDELISTLDSETPQVIIEARIVETSRTFSSDIGVNWGFTGAADAAHGTSTGLAFPHNASARYGLNLPGDTASSLGFSFSNVVDSFTLDLELNAIENEGRGRILSSPKITTQNNERAEIEQGVRIPIVNTTATEISVQFVSASLLLSVTPQITAEGTVILDIVVENNSPDFNQRAADIPSITTQRAQTKVMISDGGTTVIGGIFTVNEADSEIGVPWFRKLPIFGWLFRSHSVTNENRELLIFITPKIVKLS